MPNNDLEGNISHFILIIMLPKIAFQTLGTTKLHLGSQDPGSRKFCCPGHGLDGRCYSYLFSVYMFRETLLNRNNL